MLKKCKNYLSSLDIQKQVVAIVCHSLKTDLQLIPVFSPMFHSQLWVSILRLGFHKVDWAPDWAFLPTFLSLNLSSCVFWAVFLSQSLAFHLLSLFQESVENSCPLMAPSPFFLLLCIVDAVGTYIPSSLPVSQQLPHFQLPAPSTLRGFYLAVGVCSAWPCGRLEEPESFSSHQPWMDVYRELMSKYHSSLPLLLG